MELVEETRMKNKWKIKIRKWLFQKLCSVPIDVAIGQDLSQDKIRIKGMGGGRTEYVTVSELVQLYVHAQKRYVMYHGVFQQLKMNIEQVARMNAEHIKQVDVIMQNRKLQEAAEVIQEVKEEFHPLIDPNQLD